MFQFSYAIALFCLVLFVNQSYSNWVIDDEGCTTPDRKTGNCIALTNCEPILRVLRTIKRPVSTEVAQKLQAYNCGVDSRRKVKVCCPSESIDLEGTNPLDVSNHRNKNLLPTDCGYIDTDNRIINGENAFLNEFPWMALLSYSGKKSGFKCGGTIINQNYILTAAHCIANLKNSRLVSVRIGEHSIQNETDCELRRKRKIKCNPPAIDLSIEQVIPHPDFNPATFTNDIGLLRVSKMNLQQESTRPVCLPITKTQRTLNYTNIVVTGWGIVNPDTEETADILQKVGLPVTDKATCADIYKQHNIELHNYQLCAGGVRNKDSCPGDSGGPMVVPGVDSNDDAQYVQQGVVSFGPKYCGLPGYPGVYTLVIYYMDWILDTIRP
ncbi:serine protease easter-like [Sitophilus oryzae]|uniref:CLIP domain-containing serine protease n=1 Tax=Sitophilus oryzae TaxID=7048 RepID=A0A6J2YPA9_SITOR|nr:serine protease easter-like [Sitophilus oryzae]